MATGSPLKMMKNVFYFTLEAPFVLKISKFCLDFLVMQKNGLIRKARLILRFTTSHGSKIIAIHILINISRSKGNQAIKLGQLIEYNMTNTFLEKSYTKCGGQTIP